jgi:hypothetical protein
MAEGKWVSYLRVSTGRQGQSGLGIEAQRRAVEDFLNGGSWEVAKEYVEIESPTKIAGLWPPQTVRVDQKANQPVAVAMPIALERGAIVAALLQFFTPFPVVSWLTEVTRMLLTDVGAG